MSEGYACSSSARLNATTLTPGSPRNPSERPVVLARTKFQIGRYAKACRRGQPDTACDHLSMTIDRWRETFVGHPRLGAWVASTALVAAVTLTIWLLEPHVPVLASGCSTSSR